MERFNNVDTNITFNNGNSANYGPPITRYQLILPSVLHSESLSCVRVVKSSKSLSKGFRIDNILNFGSAMIAEVRHFFNR